MISDIDKFMFLDHASLGFPESHTRSLQLFKNSVVTPSLEAVDHEIESNLLSGEEANVFFESDLTELYQATVESYLLAIQSMWERGLRKLLIIRENRLCAGRQVNALQNASWTVGSKGLQYHFQRLLGLPMTEFDSYDDLNLLQNLANAIRHGDGPSAKRVYDLAPTLWFNWLEPGTIVNIGIASIFIPSDAPKYPSFENVTLQKIVLEQMIESVSNFWEDLEGMRCNSFRGQQQSVDQHLAKWRKKRSTRIYSRKWSPS